MVNQNKAIFLDRDGVLNDVVIKANKTTRPPYIKNELRIKYENILNLKQYEKKYFLFIVTNQPDIKKGLQTEEFNNYINHRIKKLLNITEVKTCLCFEYESNCNCYKPRTEMIFKLKKKWKLNLRKSFFIGDRWRDIICGNNSKCKTIFIRKKYNINDLTIAKPNYIVSSLNNIHNIIPIH